MALNLSTEGFARRSSRRPWTTILVWVGVLLAALALNATLLEDGLTTKFVFMNSPDSKVGFDLLEDRLQTRRRWLRKGRAQAPLFVPL